MYKVLLEKPAQAFFENANVALQRRLYRCFELLKHDPRRHPNVRALTGKLKGNWRFRLGDYRIVYRIDDNKRVVIIFVIALRRDVYD